MATIEKRKSSSGSVTYRVKVRLKGKPTESATFERLTDAKRWAVQTEASIREGRYFQSSAGKNKTLNDAIDRYVRDVLPSLKAKDSRLTHLKMWSKAAGSRHIKDITPVLIKEILDDLKATPFQIGKTTKTRSDATINRYLASLSPVMAFASEWEWISDNPCHKVRKGKESRGRTRFLTEEEVQKLLHACEEAKDTPELKIIVLLAITTGGRRGEISSLRWNHVDFQRRRVIFVDTKNGETRASPLVGPAYDALKKWSRVLPIDKNQYVFPGRTERTINKPLDFQKPWSTALKRSGIKDFRFHDLRHTAASHLAMNGAGIREIADILGHKTLEMVKRYSHLTQDHKTAVVERMTTAIFK